MFDEDAVPNSPAAPILRVVIKGDRPHCCARTHELANSRTFPADPANSAADIANSSADPANSSADPATSSAAVYSVLLPISNPATVTLMIESEPTTARLSVLEPSVVPTSTLSATCLRLQSAHNQSADDSSESSRLFSLLIYGLQPGNRQSADDS